MAVANEAVYITLSLGDLRPSAILLPEHSCGTDPGLTWCLLALSVGLNGHLMGGKLLRMAWGRYQNRQAGQQGAFAAAAGAAAATAGMGNIPGMGLTLEQQTAGYLLPPGMLGVSLGSNLRSCCCLARCVDRYHVIKY